ncbi:MAG: translocation/assembly module TamB domain-containing protein, partial [Candidatus Babeliales bacterium]
DENIGIHVDSSFELPYLGEHNTCYLTGVWDTNTGRFALRSAYDLCAIDPIIITKRENDNYVRLIARAPLSSFWRFKVDDITNNDINGNIFLSLQATFGPLSRIDGQLVFEDVQYKKQLLCDNSKIFFAKRDETWQGKITLRSHAAEFDGSWHWFERAKTGKFKLKNINTIQIPYTKWWQLLPQGFLGQIKISDDGNIDGYYQATITNQLRDNTNKIIGTMHIKDGAIDIDGTINDQRYEIAGELQPKMRLRRCNYFTKDESPLILLHCKPSHYQVIEGSIAFSFIRSLLQQCVGYDLQGQGIVLMRGMIDNSRLLADFHFAETTIRLPQTYNFIDNLNVSISYDRLKHKLLFNNIYCSLYAGSIHSSRAVLIFDQKGNCQFAHIPLLLDRCLLNLKKDLFANISGSLLFNYNAKCQSLLKGNLIIDRAQLKENLFSNNFQQELITHTSGMFKQPSINMACDVSIATKSPIRVDTDFLKADAKIALKIQNTINNPEVSGAITLLSGSLGFPYKPLYITKGSIYFLPNQLYDPHIELIAKNKIKKYNIGLQVTGSLQAHHMLFDSSPPLTDEQIIGLLLTGSEQESIPALSIMQNVQRVIFGTNQSSLAQQYFKPLLGPFSSISLIPRFSDQRGRGGMRGALEIEVNERIRALIQKNFSLTEDTKFELEYFASDDVTLRAIRDERRDIGGEVELRWKF